MKDKEARDKIESNERSIKWSDERISQLRAEHHALKDDFALLLEHLGLEKFVESAMDGNHIKRTKTGYRTIIDPFTT